MTNKIATTIGAAGIGAVAAAAVLLSTQAGAQSTALAPAAAAPTSPSSAPATHGAKPAGKGHRAAVRLKRIQHGTWVTRQGRNSTTFVTHSAVQGSVTAVSATSISVKSADNYAATFTVTKETKVKVWNNGTLADGTISSVKTGAHVVVAGVGAPTATAGHILVGTRK
ncbi:MAG: hypothetical protein ABJA87_01135 [bacterium]